MDLLLDRARKIDGWMSEAELQFLAQTARDKKLIYEIGSFTGRSTRALADNTKGIVHAIDSWNVNCYAGVGTTILFKTDQDVFNQFYCNLADHINRGKVIPSLCNWEDFTGKELADFIFIDGDHRYESVRRDIDKALELAGPNAILSGHDYSYAWPGVLKAVDESFLAVNLVDSIWWVELR